MPSLVDGQTRTMSFDASNSLMIQEMSAMLQFENDQVTVAVRLGGGDAKPGEDRLEQGDIILMMNGKRATNIEDLKTMYEELASGEEIKVGVRRGEERFIIRGTKGDIPKNSGVQMVFQNDDLAGDEEGSTPTVLPSLGLILKNSDDGITVQSVIGPLVPQEIKKMNIEGYSITKFNGKKPDDAESVKDAIEALEVGDEISLTFVKDGEEKSIILDKPKLSGSVSIKTGNN